MNFVGGDYGLVETLGMESLLEGTSPEILIDRGESVLLTRGRTMGYPNPEDIVLTCDRRSNKRYCYSSWGCGGLQS